MEKEGWSNDSEGVWGRLLGVCVTPPKITGVEHGWGKITENSVFFSNTWIQGSFCHRLINATMCMQGPLDLGHELEGLAMLWHP